VEGAQFTPAADGSPPGDTGKLFAQAWLDKEPSLAIALRFAGQRQFATRPEAWLYMVVLIEELLQGMFALSNVTVAHAKLSWWTQESQALADGAPRHPLTQALHGTLSQGQIKAFAALISSALDWLACPNADTELEQSAQLGDFAANASAFMGEGDTAALWQAFARKRQLQTHAKPERYGPSLCSRAQLAEFQLKRSELAQRVSAGPLLSALLGGVRHALKRGAKPSMKPHAGTLAYAALHAHEAQRWANFAPNAAFAPLRPALLAVLQAWWASLKARS
jgi:hypothetical protein